MAGLPDGITEEPSFSSGAQQAALIMAAKGALSHNPPSDWPCYTEEGRDGATSNLYLGLSGPLSIDGFVEDPGGGNEPVGHRAWIFDPAQVRMGFGSIPASPQSAALQVRDPVNIWNPSPPLREPSGFVSWSPRGFVPNTKIYPRWSLHKEGADFTSANVEVTVGGQQVASTVVHRGTPPDPGWLSKPLPVLTFVPTLAAFPQASDLVVSVSVTGITGTGVPTSYSWTTTAIPPTAPTSTLRPPADFNGNGSSDVSVFRPASGQWFVQGGQAFHGTNGDIPVPCDYNGDGTTDRAVFRPSVGGWYVEGQSPVFFGFAGDIPVPGHYSGSANCQIAIFRPSVGGWYFASGQSPVFHGLSGDIPVPADYDGNGTTEIAIFRPAVGGWYFASGQSPVFHGLSGDIPVPGDYDGSGNSDVAIFRRAVGGWYAVGKSPQFLGLDSDVPVPGDYDGNHTTDVAVFRPGTGAWFVGVQSPIFLGTSTDIPLPLPSAIRLPFFP